MLPFHLVISPLPDMDLSSTLLYIHSPSQHLHVRYLEVVLMGQPGVIVTLEADTLLVVLLLDSDVGGCTVLNQSVGEGDGGGDDDAGAGGK